MIMEASEFVVSQQKILIKRSGFVNLQSSAHLPWRGITRSGSRLIRRPGSTLDLNRGTARCPLVLLFAMLLSVSSRGQQKDWIDSPLLPERTQLNQGFSVQLSHPRMLEAGYMPLKIDLRSSQPFQRDRNFLLRVTTLSESTLPRVNGMEYDIVMDLEEGDSTYSKTVQLPKWFMGQSLSMSLFEEQSEVTGYQWKTETNYTSSGLILGAGGLLERETQCNWLYISQEKTSVDAGPPNLPHLLTAMRSQGMTDSKHLDIYKAHLANSPITQRRVINVEKEWDDARSSGAIHGLGINELLDDWRYYQRYDVVIIHSETFNQLWQKRDPRFTAIHRWQLLGGILVVLGAPPPDLNPLKQDSTSSYAKTPQRSSVRKAVDGLIQEELKRLLEYMKQSLPDAEIAVPFAELFVLNDKREKRSLFHVHWKTEQQGDDPTSYISEFRVDPVSTEATPTELAEFRQVSLIYHSLRMQRNIFDFYNEVDDFYPTSKALEFTGTYPVELSLGAVQEVGMGSRIFMQDTVLPRPIQWEMIKRLAVEKSSPTLRRGVDPLAGSERFLDWRIPGISEPPVYTFIGFLSTFFLLVGPVAYWQTKRIGRPYLMFAIAPVLTVITTLSMLGYSIIADGFGSHARIRQITWVDGVTGEGVERVRSTYFTGSQQQQLLRFPKQAEVFPYLDRGGASFEDITAMEAELLGKVKILESAQFLSADSLPARDQRQFISHHPRPAIGALEIQQDLPSNVPVKIDASLPNRSLSALNVMNVPEIEPKLTNSFPFPLTSVIVRDTFGNHWYIPKLDPGQSATSSALLPRDASQKLGELYTSHRPIGSSGESNSSGSTRARTLSDFALQYRSMLRARDVSLDGLLEDWLQYYLLTLGELPESHFVATAEITEDAVAIEGCEIEASVHYVVGTLR